MIEALYDSADAPDGGVIVHNNSSANLALYRERAKRRDQIALLCPFAKFRHWLIEHGHSNLSLGTLEIASREPWQSLEKQFVLTQFPHLCLGGAYIAAGENAPFYGC